MEPVLLATILAAGAGALGCAWLWRRNRELRDTLRRANAAVEELGAREKRLDAVIDTLPVATLVHDERGKLVIANRAARDLFFDGRDVAGRDFVHMLANAPPALRESVTSLTDGLKRLPGNDGGESLLLWHRTIAGDRGPLEMIVTVPLGGDVSRVESDAWRKVLRMVAHEINNSLTPITTLVSTGRVLQSRADRDDRLPKILDTIEERTRHLARFMDQYARVARLPRPRPTACALPAMLERVTQMFPGVRLDLATSAAFADATQLEQVVINLVKNAREAAGPAGTVEVVAEHVDGGTRLQVLDDGPGLAPAALSEIGVPFFTTKDGGTGLGLTLCREVVEAHHGRFAIGNRDGRGAIATVWLPGPDGGALKSRLTITRQ
ncbi:MAG: PAS domain-containing sensor histidine kinase [Kofleriaceae bacterium]